MVSLSVQNNSHLDECNYNRHFKSIFFFKIQTTAILPTKQKLLQMVDERYHQK